MKINETIAVIGLGYVGLPLAVEFGKKSKVIGFDISSGRIQDLRKNIDTTNEVSSSHLKKAKYLEFSCKEEDLISAKHFIITVPTPVDDFNIPDTSFLVSASQIVSKYISKGSHIIYESTVYPGATEEICLPILEQYTSFKYNKDFFLGYSPERINPGDKKHRITDIKKITSGSTKPAAKFIDQLYRQIITAGTHLAPSIKVAEAAKVIENTQRDLNIALINELAIIFNKLNIDTNDVIEAAATKWNFIKFKPGLVGGHCIGVDPYYLTFKAKQIGYDPKVILSGREINNYMPMYVANTLINLMKEKFIKLEHASILLLGITFKENCPDIRNSKVIDLAKIIQRRVGNLEIVDPWFKGEIEGLNISQAISVNKKYDGILLAVPHKEFVNLRDKDITALRKESSIFYDLKSLFNQDISDARL